MRFFLQTLLGIALLITGFEVGTRYQARQDLPGQTQRLVEVQKERLASLREDSSRLQTEITVREFLARERITLPRATVEDIAGSIHDASGRYEVPPEMILAVIRIESAFNTEALSHKGAVGLMQLLPSTAEQIARELSIDWTGEEILRDPSANIAMGTYYLTKLLGRFNDLSVALAAYNHGPTRIANLAEARATLPMGYTQKVLNHYSP
ncbi:MAG TPA: lytic transglycosylase domain-containing protein [Candidatus Polarisedimenticolia bacterium]|nr:lytic transglycosylase domain-containing protein [Candidatus Polarisedimenticolia bacterium]